MRGVPQIARGGATPRGFVPTGSLPSPCDLSCLLRFICRSALRYFPIRIVYEDKDALASAHPCGECSRLGRTASFLS